MSFEQQLLEEHNKKVETELLSDFNEGENGENQSVFLLPF